MRIVAWNCAMAFHRKLPALKALRPEIAVIGECAAPDTFASKARHEPAITRYFDQMEWTGTNPHKGLAVFARRGWRLRVDPSHRADLDYILPVHVEGPAPFRLLAVWAQNLSGGVSRKDQPGPFHIALDHYAEFMTGGPTVIAGDLNNSVIWDKPGWPINHADAVEILEERDIVSSYHALRDEEPGRERTPTLYWRDRKLHGPRYHLDYVFIPRPWLATATLEVGSFRRWVGTGLSDHVPLTLTVSESESGADAANEPTSRPHRRRVIGDTRRLEVTVTDIRNVIDEPAQLGECPVWSAAEEVLYWVDIDGKAVHRYDPSTGVDTHRSMAGRPGSLALTATIGRILVAVEHELLWLDWESGSTRPFVALEEAGTGNRLNDGRCDPAGRFVVGSMYADTKAGKRTGVLHQVEADGSVTRVRDGIGVTNGLAFDPTNERAYFADTHTDSIIMWDYDSDTGERRNERLFVDYTDLPGRPDGGCVDAEGCYWSASVYGWAMTRFTPDGEVERRIDVPVEKPSMPAFGGPDHRTLYVTTIRSGGTTASAKGRDGFVGGMLLEIDAGVQGIPEPLFAG